MENLIPDNLIVDRNELQCEERIGIGAYAEVWKGTWQGKGAGITVAIKKVPLTGVTPALQNGITHEVNILAKLQHPLLLRIFGSCIDQKELWIVTEFIGGGSLFDLIHSKKLTWETRLRLAHQAAASVHVLHSSGILHRDIKSLNFLVSADCEKLTLIDFGLSKHTANLSSDPREAIGTIRWCAPETLCYPPQWSDKCDIYSLGVTFWEIASCKIPFEDVPENIIIKFITKQTRPSLPDDCPQLFKSIITSCWSHNPTKRPTSQHLVDTLEKLVNSCKGNKLSSQLESITAKSSVNCNELSANRQAHIYILKKAALYRYEPANQELVSVASSCHLKSTLHRPFCIYGIYQQKLVVYFAPWERMVSLALLKDFIGSYELSDDDYYTLLLGEKFYVIIKDLFEEQYFWCIDVTTLKCERLPYPPHFPRVTHIDRGFFLVVGTGKYIHTINTDLLASEQKEKSHHIFDTENKVWKGAKCPKQMFYVKSESVPKVVFKEDVLYAFSSNIAMCYFPDSNKWKNLPLLPIDGNSEFQLIYDPATFKIWCYGQKSYLFFLFLIYLFSFVYLLLTCQNLMFDTKLKAWSDYRTLQARGILEHTSTGTIFFSNTLENGNVQTLEDQMSFIISRAPTPWKELYTLHNINEREENLMIQFEQCLLSEKVLLLKKSSEYLTMFVQFFKKQIGFYRVCELIWLMCREEPSITVSLYEHITELYWTEVFTIPVGNSFTFITKKQREEVIQNRVAAKLGEEVIQNQVQQREAVIQNQVTAPVLPAINKSLLKRTFSF